MQLPPGFPAHSSSQIADYLNPCMDSSKRADNDMRNSEQPWLLRVFIKLPHNSSIFIRFTGSFLALLVYVDDVILAGTSPDEITVLKSHLHFLKSKTWENFITFWALNLVRTSSGVHLCQRKYALVIIADAGFLGSKSASSPLVTTSNLYQSNSPPLHDNSTYRQRSWPLLYFTTTRPKISFAVQQLSQFVATPTEPHLSSIYRVLQYAPTQGLFFPAQNALQFKAFSDFDWATSPTVHKSITGVYVFLEDSLIS